MLHYFEFYRVVYVFIIPVLFLVLNYFYNEEYVK